MKKPASSAAALALLLLLLLGGCSSAQEQQQQPPLPPAASGICKNIDTDASFIGPQLSIAAGSLPAISYHRFGPLARNSGNNTSPFTNEPRRPLLLIMGYGGNMYVWGTPTYRALAQNREVIIFNNPGIGNSSFPSDIGPEKNLTYADLANHTVNFIRALQLPLKPDVVGLSQGGIIAQYIVTHHPSAINNLIVLASMPMGPEIPLSEMMLTWSPEEAAAFASNGTALLEMLFPKGLADPGACAVMSSMQALAPLGALEPIPTDVLVQYSRAGNACSTEIFDALPAVSNRVMFVHGQQDEVVPVAAAQAAAAQVPGAWLVVFADAGHGLASSYPDRFAAVVDVFLDMVDGPMSAGAAEFSKSGRLPNCPIA
jgi:pimeloyl-ACP methyl ester carboxylesterase